MIIYSQKNSSTFTKFFILLTILALFCVQINSQFCSSTCVDYIGACFGITATTCYACATSIFNLTVDNSGATPQCDLLPQTQILYE